MQFPWFGRKSRPLQSRVAPWLSAWSQADPPRSYETLVRAAFLSNPIAQRAVRLVSESVAGATLASDPLGHPALALLDETLIETIAANLILHGNAYVEVACGATGLPVALYALRPERVTVEADINGWPTAYLYRAGDALTRYPAEIRDGVPGLLHLRGYHPLDDHYGVGCLGAAAGAVEVHNAAARWNKALLDNAARPSGALIYAPADGSVLSAAQFARLKGEMADQYSGATNAGRPMLLEGGMTWQALSLTPAEMDFARIRDTASREIALAFGVPPMLLGLPGDATYANYREANVALWRLTLLPLASKIFNGLSRHLHDWWPGLSLAVDRDSIPALSADRERLWAQVSGANFMSDAEKRNMLGLDHGQ